MVILPYKDSLLLFSRYLQQLVMESLGKEFDLDGNRVCECDVSKSSYYHYFDTFVLRFLGKTIDFSLFSLVLPVSSKS